MKQVILTLTGLACGSLLSHAALISSTTVGMDVLDNSISGLASAATVSGAGTLSAGSQLQVNLNISGGWNGDLYVYLSHGDLPVAILLNQVGATAGNPAGYEEAGFAVSFRDDALNGDVHYYQNTAGYVSGNVLTGTWAPDGRLQLNGGRTSMLSTFNNCNLDGDWTLFVADLATGSTSHLESWSLEVVPVPEANTAYFGIAAIILLAGRFVAGQRKTSP